MKHIDLKNIILIIFIVSISTTASAVTFLPPGISEYEFLYDRIERNEALTESNYQLGPYSDFDFEPFSYLRIKNKDKISLFAIASENFLSEKDASSKALEKFRGGFTAQPFNNIFVYTNFILDEAKAEDAAYGGKKWRGLAGGVEEAFLAYNSKSIDFIFGRFASFWGVRRSLVLSPENRLDGIGYTIKWGRLALSYRLAKLNQEIDSLTYLNRYLAGHRLDIHFSNKFRIGLFESIIFGGVGRQIELNYLNPIIFFHSDQLNDNVNDNTFLGFDFTYKPKLGIKLYGQILVDDFQIEKNSAGDQEPDQYAIHLGSLATDMFKKTDLRIEYTRVTNWTFNQEHEHNRYLVGSQPLASVAGNDYDKLYFKLTNWLKNNKAISLYFSYNRQGQGKITDEWTAPWLDSIRNYSEKFPSGIIEKTTTLSLSAEGYHLNKFYYYIELGYNNITNRHNNPGEDKNLPFIKIKFSTFLSTDINVK